MAEIVFYAEPKLKAEVSFCDTDGKPIVLSFGADGTLRLSSDDPAVAILDSLADSQGHPIQHGDAVDRVEESKPKRPKVEEE